MTRPTMFCESCESTVSTDDVHSCYDAKAVREQQERERKLAALERAVVEAAEVFEALHGWKHENEMNCAGDLVTAVRRYREGV